MPNLDFVTGKDAIEFGKLVTEKTGATTQLVREKKFKFILFTEMNKVFGFSQKNKTLIQGGVRWTEHPIM